MTCGNKSGALLPGNRYLDFPSDGLRHLTLKSERVPQFAVVGLRPKVCVGRAANQLRGDANPTAVSYDRSFDECVHMECSGNLRYRELGVFEVHRRRSGDDAQIVDARESSDDRLGHAVGKVFLSWIARQVF